MKETEMDENQANEMKELNRRLDAMEARMRADDAAKAEAKARSRAATLRGRLVRACDKLDVPRAVADLVLPHAHVEEGRGAWVESDDGSTMSVEDAVAAVARDLRAGLVQAAPETPKEDLRPRGPAEPEGGWGAASRDELEAGVEAYLRGWSAPPARPAPRTNKPPAEMDSIELDNAIRDWAANGCKE